MCNICKLFILFIVIGLFILFFGLGLLDVWRIHHEAMRNMVLSLGSVIAMSLVAWRAMAADKANDITNKNIAIAESGQLADRFVKASEMLGSNNNLVKLAGIHTLAELGCSHFNDYAQLCSDMICSFIHHEAPYKVYSVSVDRERAVPQN
jgi:hypothetical protein